jgi:hypothetical protein
MILNFRTEGDYFAVCSAGRPTGRSLSSAGSRQAPGPRLGGLAIEVESRQFNDNLYQIASPLGTFFSTGPVRRASVILTIKNM